MLSVRILIASYFMALLCSDAFAYGQEKSTADTTKSTSKKQIVLWDRNYNDDYTREALRNILDLSLTRYGEYELVSSQPMEQGRAFANLQKGQGIDIAVGAVTKDREFVVNPIYFAIDRGLLGFRICLTRNEPNSFDEIRTIDDFAKKELQIGLGLHWPDNAIFEQYGVKAVTSSTYSNLFTMLERNRFDCFSRSLNEVDRELRELDNSNISVDPNLLFVYAFANFPFVNNRDSELKERIEYGIKRALANNSFYDIFDSHYNNVFEKYNMYDRRLIFLENDNMSTRALETINEFGIASFMMR